MLQKSGGNAPVEVGSFSHYFPWVFYIPGGLPDFSHQQDVHRSYYHGNPRFLYFEGLISPIFQGIKTFIFHGFWRSRVTIVSKLVYDSHIYGTYPTYLFTGETNPFTTKYQQDIPGPSWEGEILHP